MDYGRESKKDARTRLERDAVTDLERGDGGLHVRIGLDVHVKAAELEGGFRLFGEIQ